MKSVVRNSLERNDDAAGFFDALDENVAQLLEDAAVRTEANDRKTAKPRD